MDQCLFVIGNQNSGKSPLLSPLVLRIPFPDSVQHLLFCGWLAKKGWRSIESKPVLVVNDPTVRTNKTTPESRQKHYHKGQRPNRPLPGLMAGVETVYQIGPNYS